MVSAQVSCRRLLPSQNCTYDVYDDVSRAVVRYGSSLLGKVVDSLAPSITAILVRGKQVGVGPSAAVPSQESAITAVALLQVTLGVYGHEEEVIDKPISPADIKNILYTKCYPHDIVQAVLQQELVLSIGRFISTNPELFNGILTIRIGSV